ncbi:MAG: DUF819 family protein [Thermoanaerobaculia bacterium]|nr:DUF819 family protein [Thermoanaerobaculia bacterium]
MIHETLAILAILLGIVLVSLLLTERYPWANRLSVLIWILGLAALASNTGLIPTELPLYGSIAGFTVPFAVALVLMRVHLGDIRRAGTAMIAAFALASVATAVSVAIATIALGAWLDPLVGGESWRLAGPYTGTFIGGSLNFFALWSGLELGRPDLFAAANAVDNLSIFPLVAFWILVPRFLGSRFPVAAVWRPSTEDDSDAEETSTPRLISSHLAALSFLAIFIMWLSDWLKVTLLDPVLPGIPSILLITAFALALGQLPAVRRLEGGWEVGFLAFYLFFAAVGAMIDVGNAVQLAPVLFAYVMIIVVGHMVLVYGLGRLLRMDIGVLTIASVATKSGPAMVPAMTESLGLKHLTLPGVLMGLVGYALGNYAGVAVAYAVRAFLG